MTKHSNKGILFIIVLAQFFCTSVWFTGNAVLPLLIDLGKIPASFLPHITSSVQLGFILGTFIFALMAIADRVSPSIVFFVCALLAALFNLGICLDGINVYWILFFRFFTGIFLAGIYPVGMKIAADYFQIGLGKSLGYLVGALVLGKATPYLITSFISNSTWYYSFYVTSFIAVLGGLMIFFLVPDGPHRVVPKRMMFNGFIASFKKRNFRAFAFGYFGHMWELYSFWAFTPIIIKQYLLNHSAVQWSVPVYSFLVIGIGALACVSSGILSSKINPKKIASISLLLSATCCFISPFMLQIESANLFLFFLFFWGFVVIADSPMFSTLVANSAIPESKAAALTIVNCIGFAITIVSLQFLGLFSPIVHPNFLYMLLAIGPVLGWLAMKYD